MQKINTELFELGRWIYSYLHSSVFLIPASGPFTAASALICEASRRIFAKLEHMKPIPYLLLCLLPMALFAQRGGGNGFGAGFSEVQSGFSGLKSFYNVVNSEPITAPSNPRQLEGTPYFNEMWMKGILTLNDGKSYSGQKLRLDLLENRVHFIGPDGKEKVCANNVDRLILLDTVNDQVFTFVHSSALPVHPDFRDFAWLEALAQGPARLFKYHKKELSEVATYATAPVDRIKTQTRYYLLFDNKLQKVNSLRDVQEILFSRSKELNEYIKKNKLSWKNETDIIALISYFNSL